MLRRSFSKVLANREPLLCDSSVLSDDTDNDSEDHGVDSVGGALVPMKSLPRLLIAKPTKHKQKRNDYTARPPLPNAHDASDAQVRPSPLINQQKEPSSGESAAAVVDTKELPVLQAEKLKDVDGEFICSNEWVSFGDVDGTVASDAASDAVAVPSTSPKTKESRSKSPKKAKSAIGCEGKAMNGSEGEPLVPTKTKTKAKLQSNVGSGDSPSSPSKSKTKTEECNANATAADLPSKKSKLNDASMNKKSRNEVDESPINETKKHRSPHSNPKTNSTSDYLDGSVTPYPDSPKKKSKSSKPKDTTHNFPHNGSETATLTEVDPSTADVPDSPRKTSKKSKTVASASDSPKKGCRKSKSTDCDNDPSNSPSDYLDGGVTPDPDSPRKKSKSSKSENTADNFPHNDSDTATLTEVDPTTVDVPDSLRKTNKKSKTIANAFDSPKKGSRKSKSTECDNDQSAKSSSDSPIKAKEKSKTQIPDSPRKSSRKSNSEVTTPDSPSRKSRKSRTDDTRRDARTDTKADKKSKTLDSPKKTSRCSTVEDIGSSPTSNSHNERKTNDRNALDSPMKASSKSEPKPTTASPIKAIVEKAQEANGASGSADANLMSAAMVDEPGSPKGSESKSVVREPAENVTGPELPVVTLKTDEPTNAVDLCNNKLNASSCSTCQFEVSPMRAVVKSEDLEANQQFTSSKGQAPSLVPFSPLEKKPLARADFDSNDRTNTDKENTKLWESPNVDAHYPDSSTNADTINFEHARSCTTNWHDQSGNHKTALQKSEASVSAGIVIPSASKDPKATPIASQVFGAMVTESDAVEGPAFATFLPPEIPNKDLNCVPKLEDNVSIDEREVATVNQSTRKHDAPREANSESSDTEKNCDKKIELLCLPVSVDDDPRTPSTGYRRRWIKRQPTTSPSNESSKSRASNGSSILTFEEENLMEAVWLDITLADDDDKQGPIKEVKNFFDRPFNKPSTRDSSSDDSSSDSDSEHPSKSAGRPRISATENNTETEASLVSVVMERPAEVEKVVEMLEPTMSESPVPATETLLSVQGASEDTVSCAPATRLSLDGTDSESSDDGSPLTLHRRPGGDFCSTYDEQGTGAAKRRPPPARVASKTLENVISLKDRMRFLTTAKCEAESGDHQDFRAKTGNEVMAHPRVNGSTNPRFQELKRLAQKTANEIAREEENRAALKTSFGKPRQTVSLFPSPPRNRGLACSTSQSSETTTQGPSNRGYACSELTKVPVSCRGNSMSAIVTKVPTGSAINARFQEPKGAAMKTANESVSHTNGQLNIACQSQPVISTPTNPSVKMGLAPHCDCKNPVEYKNPVEAKNPAAQASTMGLQSNSRFQELKRLAMKNANEINSDGEHKDSQDAARRPTVSSTFQQLREHAMRISQHGSGSSEPQSPQHSSHSSTNYVSSKHKVGNCFSGPRQYSECSMQAVPHKNDTASATRTLYAPKVTNCTKSFDKMGRLRDGEHGSESSSAVEQQHQQFCEKLGGTSNRNYHSVPIKQSKESSHSNSTSGIIRETTQVVDIESPQRRLTLDNDSDSGDDDFHNDFKASTQFADMRAQARLRSPPPGRHPSLSLNHVASIKDRQKLFQSK